MAEERVWGARRRVRVGAKCSMGDEAWSGSWRMAGIYYIDERWLS